MAKARGLSTALVGNLGAASYTPLQCPAEGPTNSEHGADMDEWLRPLVAQCIETEDSLSAAVAVPFSPNPDEAFFMLGDAAGMLHVYQFPAKKLLSYDTQHGAAVTTIAFGKRDDSLLVTAAADGSLESLAMRTA